MNMGHEVGFLVDHGGVDCGDYRVLGHDGPWNVVPCWSIWLWRPVMHRKDPFFSWLEVLAFSLWKCSRSSKEIGSSRIVESIFLVSPANLLLKLNMREREREGKKGQPGPTKGIRDGNNSLEDLWLIWIFKVVYFLFFFWQVGLKVWFYLCLIWLLPLLVVWRKAQK